MLLVPTRLAPSTIHGMGVITDVALKAGQPVWKSHRDLDQILPISQVQLLPEPARTTILHFAYRSISLPDHYILEFDNGRFMNHAEDANLDFSQDEYGIATRDITAGEELTCNYRQFCVLEDFSFLTQA